MPWDLGQSHKPNHNSYALYYHVVFVTYRRQALIDSEIAAFLKRFFSAKCDDLGIHLVAQGIVCDHVHLLLSLRPADYIPEMINYLKGTASHEANNHHDFEGNLGWMRGYRINTVSERNLEQAAQYVQRQVEHHPDKIPPQLRREK